MVYVDVGKCLGCGSCETACPRGAITLGDGQALIDQARCDGCRRCIDACPSAAIYVVEATPAAARLPALVPLASSTPVWRPLERMAPIVRLIADSLAPLAIEVVARALERRLAAPEFNQSRGVGWDGGASTNLRTAEPRRRWRRRRGWHG